MAKTKIEWADYTWNPVIGCAGPENGTPCHYCYAADMAKRFAAGYADRELAYCKRKGLVPFEQDREKLVGRIRAFRPTPMYHLWNPALPAKPVRVFVGSMSDIADWGIASLTSAKTFIRSRPQHAFLFLTKRPGVYERMEDFPANCWFGVTINDRNGAWRVADLINNCSSTRRKFISHEPAFEFVDLDNIGGCSLDNEVLDIKSISWYILGGQSGRDSERENGMVPADVVRNARDQAIFYDIPFFFKQWGGHKKGDQIDRKTWHQIPATINFKRAKEEA